MLDDEIASAEQLMSDVTSGDSRRVWSSSCAIIKLRDGAALTYLAVHFEEIKRRIESVPLGGALFPNNEHLKTALRKLEMIRYHVGCLCALYPTYLMFDPRRLEEVGDICIEGLVYANDKWIGAYTCICTHCGARFRVEEREYHYVWWDWQPTLPTN